MMVIFIALATTKPDTGFLITALVFVVLFITIPFILILLEFVPKLITKLITKFKLDKKPKLKLFVPFPNYVTYPKEYNLFIELFNPKSSPFSKT